MKMKKNLPIIRCQGQANPCCHLIALHHGRWKLTESGKRELELLTY